MNFKNIIVLIPLLLILFLNFSCTNNPKSLTDMGNELYIQGKDDEALACFDEALKLDPDNTYALISKGKVLYYLAEYHKAQEFCNRVLQIDPEHEEGNKLNSNLYKVNFNEAKAAIFEHTILCFAICNGYIKDWEDSKDTDSASNSSLNKLHEEIVEKGLLEDLETERKRIDYLMSRIKAPPDEYKNLYIMLEELNEKSKEIYTLSIFPKGSYKDYKEKVNTMDKTSEELYYKVKETTL